MVVHVPTEKTVVVTVYIPTMGTVVCVPTKLLLVEVVSVHTSSIYSHMHSYLLDISLRHLEHVYKNCFHYDWLCSSLVLSHFLNTVHCPAISPLCPHQL